MVLSKTLQMIPGTASFVQHASIRFRMKLTVKSLASASKSAVRTLSTLGASGLARALVLN